MYTEDYSDEYSDREQAFEQRVRRLISLVFAIENNYQSGANATTE